MAPSPFTIKSSIKVKSNNHPVSIILKLLLKIGHFKSSLFQKFGIKIIFYPKNDRGWNEERVKFDGCYLKISFSSQNLVERGLALQIIDWQGPRGKKWGCLLDLFLAKSFQRYNHSCHERQDYHREQNKHTKHSITPKVGRSWSLCLFFVWCYVGVGWCSCCQVFCCGLKKSPGIISCLI